MPYSFTALSTMLDNTMPQSVVGSGWTTIKSEAINRAVQEASPEYREETWLDILGDGATARFALVGNRVTVLPAYRQIAPVAINLSGVPAPTVAPSAAASGSGASLPAGTYKVAYAYVTANGAGPISPFTTVTITAGQGIAVSGITVPSTLAATVTAINLYLPLTANGYDERVAATISNPPVAPALVPTQTLTTLPLSTAASAYRDYTALNTLSPLLQQQWLQTEHNVNLDGTPPAPGAAPQAIVTFGTLQGTTFTAAPIPAGTLTRLWYTRDPLLPANTSALIPVPDEWLTLAATAYCHFYLAAEHGTGDGTNHAALFNALYPTLITMKRQTAGRANMGVRSFTWT